MKRLFIVISFSIVSLCLVSPSSFAQSQDTEALKKTPIGIKNVMSAAVVKTLSECSMSPSHSELATIKFFGKEENQQPIETAQKIINSYLKDFLEKSNISVVKTQDNYDTQLIAIYSDGYEMTYIPEEARRRENIPSSEAVKWLIKPILYLSLKHNEKEQCAQTFETSIDPVPNSPFSYERVKNWINESVEKFLNSCHDGNSNIEPNPFLKREVIGQLKQENVNKSLEIEEMKTEMGNDPNRMFDISSRVTPGALPFWTRAIIYRARSPKGEAMFEIKKK